VSRKRNRSGRWNSSRCDEKRRVQRRNEPAKAAECWFARAARGTRAGLSQRDNHYLP